jgi:hypothetical protein
MSMDVPSGFFLLVYFLFSGFEFGDSPSAGWLGTAVPPGVVAVVVVFPALDLFCCGGGVTPPFASRLAASFCSRANSARSRLDIIPSLGGLPGPRRRAGGCCPSPDPSTDCATREISASFVLNTIFVGFEPSLILSASSCSFSAAATDWEFSSSGANGSSSISAPVSPIGTSGSKNRIRTPPICI